MNAANTLKAAARYFAIVFAAGFLLALIRIPWLVPRYGVRIAELIELPVMLVVIFFAARWTVRHRLTATTKATQLAVGLIALGLLLLTEFTLVLWLQGLSLRVAIARRDQVSGAAYALSLMIFALMPWIVARNTHPPDRQ
jgi:hypothetical protein